MRAIGALQLGVVLVSSALWAGKAAAVTDFGNGRPISDADLSGKRFCWSNGHWAVYGAGGKMINDRGGHLHWSVPKPGILQINSRYVQVEVLADGTLHSYVYSLLTSGGDPSHDYDGWGKPCDDVNGDFAKGRPVTAADLSGKKFCWSNGHWGLYGLDGFVTNDYGKHPQWSVPKPGVLHIGDHYRSIEVLRDGRLHLSGDDGDGWGTVCN